MQEHAASRTAARIAAAAGAVFAVIGLLLLFGTHPGGGLAGIGTAFQTVIAGVLLVAAAVIGLAAVFFWLVARRHTRRRRRENRILL